MKISEDKLAVMLLGVSSLVFIVSIFILKHYVFAFGLTQYILVVAYCVWQSNKGNKIDEIIEYTCNEAEKAVEEKDIFKIIKYNLAVPAILIGVITIIMMTIAVWIIKF